MNSYQTSCTLKKYWNLDCPESVLLLLSSNCMDAQAVQAAHVDTSPCWAHMSKIMLHHMVFYYIFLYHSERENITANAQCNQGCGHPEYDVVAFTLNR